MRRLLRCLQAAAGLAGMALAGTAGGALPAAAPQALPAAAACVQPHSGKSVGAIPGRPVQPPTTSVHVHCAAAPPSPATPLPAPAPAPASLPTPSAPALVPTSPAPAPPAVATGAAPAAAASAARFGDHRHDGPILVALFAATAFAVVGLGLLSSALGWPRISAGTRYTSAEADYTAAPAEAFAFRRHWGSFGAESTGWTMSSSLARLLAGLGLIALAAMLLLVLMSAADPAAKPAGRVSTATGSAPAPVKSPLLPAGA